MEIEMKKTALGPSALNISKDRQIREYILGIMV